MTPNGFAEYGGVDDSAGAEKSTDNCLCVWVQVEYSQGWERRGGGKGEESRNVGETRLIVNPGPAQ